MYPIIIVCKQFKGHLINK